MKQKLFNVIIFLIFFNKVGNAQIEIPLNFDAIEWTYLKIDTSYSRGNCWITYMDTFVEQGRKYYQSTGYDVYVPDIGLYMKVRQFKSGFSYSITYNANNQYSVVNYGLENCYNVHQWYHPNGVLGGYEELDWEIRNDGENEGAAKNGQCYYWDENKRLIKMEYYSKGILINSVSF